MYIAFRNRPEYQRLEAFLQLVVFLFCSLFTSLPLSCDSPGCNSTISTREKGKTERAGRKVQGEERVGNKVDSWPFQEVEQRWPLWTWGLMQRRTQDSEDIFITFCVQNKAICLFNKMPWISIRNYNVFEMRKCIYRWRPRNSFCFKRFPPPFC